MTGKLGTPHHLRGREDDDRRASYLHPRTRLVDRSLNNKLPSDLPQALHPRSTLTLMRILTKTMRTMNRHHRQRRRPSERSSLNSTTQRSGRRNTAPSLDTASEVPPHHFQFVLRLRNLLLVHLTILLYTFSRVTSRRVKLLNSLCHFPSPCLTTSCFSSLLPWYSLMYRFYLLTAAISRTSPFRVVRAVSALSSFEENRVAFRRARW